MIQGFKLFTSSTTGIEANQKTDQPQKYFKKLI